MSAFRFGRGYFRLASVCLLKLDLSSMNAVWSDFYSLLRAIACSQIPIVAAITRHARAGKTALAIFYDWRVGTEGDSKLGLMSRCPCPLNSVGTHGGFQAVTLTSGGSASYDLTVAPLGGFHQQALLA